MEPVAPIRRISSSVTKVQVSQHIALVKVPSNLLGILNTVKHEVGSTTTLGVYMDRHALLVGFDNQLNHLIVVVEALNTVIARLVEVILVFAKLCGLRSHRRGTLWHQRYGNTHHSVQHAVRQCGQSLPSDRQYYR